MALPLIQHGQRVRLEYAPDEGQTQSWAGKSTDEERPDGEVSGIVRRFDKGSVACDNTLAFELIKRAYADSVEFSLTLSGTRGLMLVFAAVAALMFGWLLSVMVASSWFGYFDAVMALGIIAFLLWLWIRAIRLELFTPRDEPTIFDRQHRKVYRLFREVQPGLKGLFKPWPLIACAYEWDLLDAEHTATVVTTGSTITRQHALVFIVRKSADDPTIIDSFNISNSLFLGETTVAPLYEHIRRFMEDNGPHLPPGEKLAGGEQPDATPFTWAGYKHWWREQRGMMILYHAILPMFLLWGLFNWLAHKTSVPIEWPREVLDAVGPPLDERQLAEAAQRAAERPVVRAPAHKSGDTPPKRSRNAQPQPWSPPKPPPQTAQPPAAELLDASSVEHEGGPLTLMLDDPRRRKASYLVVDSTHQTHRGTLDADGRATLEDVPAGRLSIAYFAAASDKDNR